MDYIVVQTIVRPARPIVLADYMVALRPRRLRVQLKKAVVLGRASTLPLEASLGQCNDSGQ